MFARGAETLPRPGHASWILAPPAAPPTRPPCRSSSRSTLISDPSTGSSLRDAPHAAYHVLHNPPSPSGSTTSPSREPCAARIHRVKGSVPMRRGGRPEEVAQAILWLLSGEASYVTGTFVELSGGA